MPGPVSVASHRVAARAALIAAASLLIFSASASAKTHTFKVKSTKDAVHGSCSSKCSLRDAVIAADKAGGKSTIIVPAGHYKLTIDATSSGDPTDNPAAGDLDINAGAQVTIKGAGPTKTILDANLIDRMFAVHQHAALTVSGVTVENGTQIASGPSDHSISPGVGGAIYNDGSLTVTKSDLTANTSYDAGGVIYSDAAAVATSITDSTATTNVSYDPGAVIYALHGRIDVAGDTIEHNFAYDGDGIVYGAGVGSVVVSHTKLEYNTADGSGGALYLEGAGKVAINHSTLSQSTAGNHGGAVYLQQTGDISISHSTFAQNASAAAGGVLYLYNTSSASVVDSKFSDNTAQNDEDGGAIYAENTDRLTVSGSSFDSNTAGAGGAIDTDSANVSVTRTHFTDNTATDGGAIYLEAETATALDSISASVFTADRSDAGDGGALYDSYGELALSGSTFYADSAVSGGGLFFASRDGTSLANDTFDSNTATDGGALFFDTTVTAGQLVLRNDTITRNVAYLGGGIFNPFLANTIVNTIVAGNFAEPGHGADTGNGDCDYAFDYNATAMNYTGIADRGHNLDSDHSCIDHPTSHPALGDKTANPKLGPLKNNGGPVPTDALLKGSPAIGAADKAQCPKTDARGVKRTGKCSIGAYQAAPNKKRKKK